MLGSIPQVDSVTLVSGALSAIEHMQTSKSFTLVIDANLPPEEVESLVRWSKRHQPATRCIVLVKGMIERESAYSVGADAVFLRSSSAQELAEALWPEELG